MRTVSVTLVVALTFTLVVVASSLYAPQTPQTYKGFEIAIKSIERVGSKWVYKEAIEFTAKPGGELVVVTFTVKALDDSGSFEPKTWALYATDGAEAETLIKSFSLRAVWRGETREAQLCYGVSKGTPLKTFKLDGVSFDVTALDKSLSNK